jgi:2,3-bisphosphoglycerate-independent phosphoglycerate mutase
MNKVNLIILDGFGIAPSWAGNALTTAKMPNWTDWWKRFPHSTLWAHGKYVGLPDDEVGNSEVGHLTIGAGRLILQNSSKINLAIEDGSFYRNKHLLHAFNIANGNDRPVHIMGLISKASVHASFNHLQSLIKLASLQKVRHLYLHLFMDGRDSGSEDGIILLEQLKNIINQYKIGEIATLSGRYYAMDRDQRLDRTKKVVDCLVDGFGDRSNSPTKVLSFTYSQGKTDEFVTPTAIVDDQKQPIGLMKDGDPIIFFNFRADRARQITEMLAQKLPQSSIITFMPYGTMDGIDLPNILSAFVPEQIGNGLATYLSHNHINQFHIAETEKYAHVTYFFNSGIEKVNPGEDRVIIPSPKVSVYDKTPRMSAPGITANLLSALSNPKYQFTVTNFANADMVGHTGNLAATQLAVEELDSDLGQIVATAASNGWYTIITADHGNAEEMVDSVTGMINPEHTKNQVPFLLITPPGQNITSLIPAGTLADVAPTIISIFGLKQPEEMTGHSLIQS